MEEYKKNEFWNAMRQNRDSSLSFASFKHYFVHSFVVEEFIKEFAGRKAKNMFFENDLNNFF